MELWLSLSHTIPLFAKVWLSTSFYMSLQQKEIELLAKFIQWNDETKKFLSKFKGTVH